MLKILAIFSGLIFLAIGVLGFLPEYTPQGKLLGIITVNPAINSIHLIAGFIAILCGLSSSVASKAFFIIFGLAYAGIAGYGFYHGEGLLFGMIASTMTVNWLHTAIAVVFLYFGFKLKTS